MPPPMPDGTAHDGLCARLRGEHVPITDAILAEARQHRVHLLLAATVGRIEAESSPVAQQLLADARGAVAVDLVRERMLRGIVHSFERAGIDALLLKGAGLAYTLYSAPHMRPRSDLDMMVARLDLERAERALFASGWLRVPEPDVELVATQRHYRPVAPSMVPEQLDLHWTVAIPQVFRDAVSFEELRARSVPVPALGPAARTVGDMDALFIACLHRVAHHQDEIDLLWLWDIHLLASRLSDDERARFVELAARTSMRAVCARGLELAAQRFGTTMATGHLVARRDQRDREPAERFLEGNRRQVDLVVNDLQALPTWRARLSLLREHLFPDAAYMRSAFPQWPAVALPLAYAVRIVRGVPKWIRRKPR